MCGIVGVIGDLWPKDEILMRRMFLLDWMRGPDATGLATVRKNGEVKIAKVADHPIVLFDTGRYQEAIKSGNAKVYIGHNRAATRGANNHNNAHPFQVDHIVGCHNGTLDEFSFNELNKELGENYTCDSHAVIHAIAKFGLKAAIGKIRGSWSLAYYDAKDDTFNLLRNDARPMWFGYTKDFKHLFYASEYPMIDAAARLTGNYEMYEEPKTEFCYFKTDVNYHYRWNVTSLANGSEKVPKPRVKEVKGKETVSTGNSTASNPFCRDRTREKMESTRNTGTNNGGTGTGTQSNKTTLRGGSLTSNGGREGVAVVVGHRLRPFGRLLDKSAFDRFAAYGCSYCEDPIEYGSLGVAIYERDGTILCSSCSGEGRRNRLVVKAKTLTGEVA